MELKKLQLQNVINTETFMSKVFDMDIDGTSEKVNKFMQGKKEIKLTDNLFEQLMGKKPEFRFKFIQDNANFIRQVDI